MTIMDGRAFVVGLGLSLALAGPGVARAQSLIDRVAWLQGCWQFAAGDRIVDEQWTAPRGGAMLGVSRTTRGAVMTEHEFVRLVERGGRLVYEAHPSGQAGAAFTSSTIEADAVVFENPAHDFPQRIGYRRVGADELRAWIEGPRGGTTRRAEFPYRRAACPAGPPRAR